MEIAGKLLTGYVRLQWLADATSSYSNKTSFPKYNPFPIYVSIRMSYRMPITVVCINRNSFFATHTASTPVLKLWLLRQALQQAELQRHLNSCTVLTR